MELKEIREIYQTLDRMEAEVRRLKGMLEPLMGSAPIRVPTEHPHIERVEGVCGGEPVIEGTRIPVWIIAARMKRGETPEKILEAYPWLTEAQVQDAIGYYHDHKEEIEQAIYQNSEEFNRE